MTDPTLTAIETRYAGCRFRSRLEARWARFFDHMSIRWQYEPEGFIVHDRMALATVDTWSYLPDFWLPELGMWAEVKGSWDTESARRFLSTAAYLSEGGHDVLLLPAMPRINGDQFPTLSVFHLEDDALSEHAWHPWCGTDTAPYMHQMRVVAQQGDMQCTPTDLLGHWRWRMRGQGTPPAVLAYIRAIESARSARFEHGECG